MGACSCLFRSPLPWLAALSSLLAFAHSSDFSLCRISEYWFWFSDFSLLGVFLTSSAIVLYPLIIFWTKSCQQKSTLKEDAPSSTRDGDAQADKQDSLLHQDCCQNVAPSSTKDGDAQADKQDSLLHQDCCQNVSDNTQNELDMKGAEISDCERFDEASLGKDSEDDWISEENLSGKTQFSDGSISDEESLIEITLPEGHYVESKSSKREQQQPWSYGFHQQKWSDCSLESHFRHLNWMDMLMEEENLIEIDIGMGSIKYSRFQIEA